MNSYLQIDHLDKTFVRGNRETKVLKDVSVSVEKGQFVSIIGHSGCGKTTLLNIVAGLTQATLGGVLLEGREVNEPGPDRAVVFQNHSLLPWLTVYENVRLAVDKVFGATKSRAERHAWTLHNLDLVQMSHAKDKRPAEISGGMKQRVGLARALAMEPKVLLLDEPFGALDALTRAHLQDSVMALHQKLGNTVLMITHDVDEAVLLSDRIVMMTNGPAAQIGEMLDVPLARPRKRLELAANPTYLKCRQRVLEFLYERHRYRGSGVTNPCRDSGESMTPDQVKAVQASFAKVAPIADTAAGIFYGRLFEIAPEVTPLFRDDMTEQGRKLMSDPDRRGQRPRQSRSDPAGRERAREEPRRLRGESLALSRRSAPRCCGRSSTGLAPTGRPKSRTPGARPTRRSRVS